MTFWHLKHRGIRKIMVNDIIVHACTVRRHTLALYFRWVATLITFNKVEYLKHKVMLGVLNAR